MLLCVEKLLLIIKRPLIVENLSWLVCTSCLTRRLTVHKALWYFERDDMYFPVFNSNRSIYQLCLHDVYVSQLIRYARACSNYHELLTKQSCSYQSCSNRVIYLQPKLRSTFKKFMVDIRIWWNNMDFLLLIWWMIAHLVE